MPRFFTNHIRGDTALITGGDAAHIAGSLRMKPGESLTICDLAGTDYDCKILSADSGEVSLRILSRRPSAGESRLHIRLFQALPKGDKLEFIVQKATELGAAEIIPVLTSRCISRPDAKSMEKKKPRLQKIAEEAAKQSGRGRIPVVGGLLSFDKALEEMATSEKALFFYEHATVALREQIGADMTSVSLFIGSEGGFSPEEAEKAREAGLLVTGLGARILSCETAPLCAISAILFAAGEF
jgi:16S rRNA (uracil1498-N3)-methyltransferase